MQRPQNDGEQRNLRRKPSVVALAKRDDLVRGRYEYPRHRRENTHGDDADTQPRYAIDRSADHARTRPPLVTMFAEPYLS